MAGRRKGWSALSESYRRRLERGGVGKSEYEAGASLKSARGHKTTPESPRAYSKNPGRYKEYRERRMGLIDRVIEKKKAAYHATLMWNEVHSADYVREDARESGKRPTMQPERLMETGPGVFINPPTMKQLKAVDAMTVDELVDYQYEVRHDDDWRFLWYH